MSRLLPTLLGLLFWSAVAEFLLLRVFLRTGQFLPGVEALLPFYRLVETLGLAALNLATLAAVALLVAVAASRRWSRPGEALLGGALVLAILANLGLGVLLELAPAALAVALHAVATAAAVAAVALVAGQQARGRVALGLIAAAQVLALYHVLAQGGAGLGLSLPGGALPISAAEALALAAALALPWALGVRPTRRQLWISGGLGLVLFAGTLVRPWTVSTITMWTVGFSLFLPGALYAAGLAAVVASLLALRSGPGGQPLAAGLLLVALAGLKLDFTYFTLLGLAGLLAATGQVQRDGETARQRDSGTAPTLALSRVL